MPSYGTYDYPGFTIIVLELGSATDGEESTSGACLYEAACLLKATLRGRAEILIAFLIMSHRNLAAQSASATSPYTQKNVWVLLHKPTWLLNRRSTASPHTPASAHKVVLHHLLHGHDVHIYLRLNSRVLLSNFSKTKECRTLKPQFTPSLECWSVLTLACLSHELSIESAEFATRFVVTYDVVPCFSFSSVEGLKIARGSSYVV
ncbi:hypothetical protein L7F22_001270 [Adiantum nelumboides]|nr:hypothetical protein [Adiantum nelumboides]